MELGDRQAGDRPRRRQPLPGYGNGAFPPEMRSPEAHAKFLTEQFDFYAKLFAAMGVVKGEAR